MSKPIRLLRVTTLPAVLALAACSAAAAPTAVAPTSPPATVAPTAVAPTSLPATVAPPATAAPTQPPATIAAATAAPTAAAQAPATTPGAAPVFSKSTEITNRYFPVSLIAQTIALGREGGASAREEVTLLPDVKTISWAGGDTQVRVSQFVAYGNGKLVEVAYDYFAQADNGDVYYFGEDVANYQRGRVANREGSWLAGKDGAPPALIMPANPQVGMVFNPENLPGVVYETDEVLSMSEQAMTPAGPVSDAMLIKETLMEGSIEYKLWVAGLGIVEDRSGSDKVTLVLANQAGDAPRAVPGPLQTIEAQAEDMIDVVPGGDWAQVSGDVVAVVEAWKIYQAQAAGDGAPQVFQDALVSALDRLQRASSAKDATRTLQAANDLSAAVVDLFSVYHPAAPADLGRLDVLERQVVLDVAANNFTAVADGLAKIDAIWARLKPALPEQNSAGVAAQFDASLTAQRTAWNSKDGSALTAEAKQALEIVDALEQLY